MDAQGAQAAIDALNSKEFDGREIRVDEAREKRSGGRF
jgi:RNA recognition motif-containing protein